PGRPGRGVGGSSGSNDCAFQRTRCRRLAASRCSKPERSECARIGVHHCRTRLAPPADPRREVPAGDTKGIADAGSIERHLECKLLMVGSAGEGWLDVHDRRSIDRFDRTNAQTILLNLADRYPVKSDWIRPIRRTGGKYAGEPAARIRTGSNLARA